MPEQLDALFISFYANADRWHNDDDLDYQEPSLARTRALLSALSADEWMKDEVDVVLDGKLYDFSRFLSWVAYDSTAEHVRYDPFNMTLLAGTFYLNLLHQHGFRVRVANNVDRRTLRQLERSYAPRFVMLSTTLMFDAAEWDVVPIAVRQIRRHWPDAVVVLGGLMLVSYQKIVPREVFLKRLLFYGADVYVVTPQGENATLEVVRRGSLKALADNPDVPGAYVVSGGRVYEPPERPEQGMGLEDTYIRWSHLPQTDHLYHTVHTRTARSCAFKCAFCEYPVNQGPLTLTPVEVVDRELADLRSLGTVRSVIFTDDTFNVPLGRFKELLKVLGKYDFEWYSFFRPQYADAETARLMKSSGCKAVFAGLESVDEAVLKNMNKVAKADEYRRGLGELKKHDIRVHANFIVGFPGETEASARKIAPFLNEMGIDFYTITTWIYLPSTPIGRRAKDFEIEGIGTEWKHSTMTSGQAQQLAREIGEEPKYSVHNAVRGEAWSEFLLYANGLSVDEARLAIGTFNRFLGRDTPEEEVKASADYASLRALLRRRDVPRPRG